MWTDMQEHCSGDRCRLWYLYCRFKTGARLSYCPCKALQIRQNRLCHRTEFRVLCSTGLLLLRLQVPRAVRHKQSDTFGWHVQGVHDIHYLKDIQYNYHHCTSLGDKGYLSASVQLDLFETSEIWLEVPYRLNQKDWRPTFAPFAKARKRWETLSSQLVDQFMVHRNYAKQQVGLFARIISKVSATTILQYINFINNKPIGRIKYALV